MAGDPERGSLAASRVCGCTCRTGTSLPHHEGGARPSCSPCPEGPMDAGHDGRDATSRTLCPDPQAPGPARRRGGQSSERRAADEGRDGPAAAREPESLCSPWPFTTGSFEAALRSGPDVLVIGSIVGTNAPRSSSGRLEHHQLRRPDPPVRPSGRRRTASRAARANWPGWQECVRCHAVRNGVRSAVDDGAMPHLTPS